MTKGRQQSMAGPNGGCLLFFENVCEILGIEPVYLRQKLLRWKKEQLNVGPKG